MNPRGAAARYATTRRALWVGRSMARGPRETPSRGTRRLRVRTVHATPHDRVHPPHGDEPAGPRQAKAVDLGPGDHRRARDLSARAPAPIGAKVDRLESERRRADRP